MRPRPTRIAALSAVAALIAIPAVWFGVDPTLARIVLHGPPDWDDYSLFPSRTLTASPAPFRFVTRTAPGAPAIQVRHAGATTGLDELLQRTGTLAFLVVRDDALLIERYFGSFSRGSRALIFSASKSLTSLLVGAALDDRILGSVDEPIVSRVPELAGRGFQRVILSDLLDGRSGIAWRETGFPLDPQPHLYYSSDTPAMLFGLRLAAPPGGPFQYRSADNQLLGLALSRALAASTLTSYLQQKLWTPMGMEFDGAWNLDREGGLEKTFCCLSMRALDFAKFGRLVMRGGDWNGRQLVPRTWIEDSTHSPGGAPWSYRRHWWLPSPERGDVLASGLMGQLLYVDPGSRTLVVRLGSSRDAPTAEQWVDVFRQVIDALDAAPRG